MKLPILSRLLLFGSSGVLAMACVAHAQTKMPPASAALVSKQPSATTQTPAGDAKTAALFEATCSSCHELSQSTSQSMDRAGWSSTIERMIGYGASLTPAQADELATYLAATHGPAPKPSGG
jgi:competence protein ComEA